MSLYKCNFCLLRKAKRKKELSTRFIESQLLMYMTPEVKITNFNIEEESMMGTSFIVIFHSPTSQTSFTSFLSI